MLSSKADNMPEGAGENRTVIAAVGVSHQDTPIAIREKLSIPSTELAGVLERIRAIDGVKETAALCTCNRVEMYTVLDSAESGLAERTASELCEARGVRFEDVRPSLYIFEGLDAVRHLFEVACGLDSMVPGENEVFGQLKSAYSAAVDAGAAGPDLSRLYQRAFKVAKDVRSRTGISQRRVSVATIVADLAKKVFGKLDRTRIALIGAGDMAELTLKALVAEKAIVSVIANRSAGAAEELASCYGGRAVGLDGIESEALAADVVVASTASPEPIISARGVKDAVGARRGRPMLLVDLGVPRNIEPEAADIADVILYDIDDLQSVVAENVAYRLEQADQAKALISGEVMKFASLLRTDAASDAIAELSGSFKQIGEDECNRTLGRLGELSDEQRRELGFMAQRIVGKMLHPPIKALKEEARRGNGRETERMIRRIFGL